MQPNCQNFMNFDFASKNSMKNLKNKTDFFGGDVFHDRIDVNNAGKQLKAVFT